MKKLSQAIVLASALTAGLAAVQSVNAEVSATASVATEYLWRGQNLSGTSGAPAFSGSLDYAHESGLYAGVWAGSGDAALGTETDLYVGFANEVEGFGYDLGYVTYIYSESAADEFDDAAEFYLGFSYDLAGVKFYKSSDSDVDGLYTLVSLDFDPVGVAIGNTSDVENEYTHIDLSYAYNDNLTFTYSKIVDQSVDFEDGGLDKSGRFVVGYSLPIEL